MSDDRFGRMTRNLLNGMSLSVCGDSRPTERIVRRSTELILRPAVDMPQEADHRLYYGFERANGNSPGLRRLRLNCTGPVWEGGPCFKLRWRRIFKRVE
jgi:hypothetical protein